MKKKKYRQIRFMTAAFIVLIALFAYMLILVNSIQGNARVINYTGMVRGATQRLVKNELFGLEDNEEILRLDNILMGLRTGEGEFQIKALDNKLYQDRLTALMVKWNELKELIYDARTDDRENSSLYDASEVYFHMADNTVSAAELYAHDLTLKLKYLEMLMITDIFLLLFSLLSQIARELNENRKLKSIAYIDPNTGLPNKRSCEMKLSQRYTGAEMNVCCFMFDLNCLKKVNDTLGHAAGDLLIRSFADVLKLSAPSHMFIGRLGGDEFIGICEDLTSYEITDFLMRLEEETCRQNSIQISRGIELSFASGYATSLCYPHLSVRELMEFADSDMYKNKALYKRAEERTVV